MFSGVLTNRILCGTGRAIIMPQDAPRGKRVFPAKNRATLGVHYQPIAKACQPLFVFL
jgi:hypothetical protein